MIAYCMVRDASQLGACSSPFPRCFAGCLVVLQNEDSAVFDGISIDVVAGGAVAPYSAIAAVFRRFFRL